MRRIAFALVLVVASGWAVPSQAQWWGGGWGRPCFGGCRPWLGGAGWAWPRRFVVLGDAPRPGWGAPEGFGPSRFRAGGWGWGRSPWRRDMRWRRFEAWRRGDAAGRPRLRRWTRWGHPLPVTPARSEPPPAVATAPARDERRAPIRADAAVAMVPTGALRFAPTRARAAIPSRVLATVVMLRRPAAPVTRAAPLIPAVIRGPELRARPALPRAVAPRADVRPVGLRSEPAPLLPAVQAAPAAPEPAPAPPADVPVAPLD